MDSLGYIFGLVSFVMYFTLNAKVSKLERMMKEAGIGKQKSASLKEVFEKNIDRNGLIEFEKDVEDGDFNAKPCRILDVDED